MTYDAIRHVAFNDQCVHRRHDLCRGRRFKRQGEMQDFAAVGVNAGDQRRTRLVEEVLVERDLGRVARECLRESVLADCSPILGVQALRFPDGWKSQISARHGERLLLSSRVSLSEIALLCGYSDHPAVTDVLTS